MYVRKKKNRLGTISVVVVSKSSGRYKEIKIFGTSSSLGEIDLLCKKVAGWINLYGGGGQQELDFENRKGCELNDTERFINNVDNILINRKQTPDNRLGPHVSKLFWME